MRLAALTVLLTGSAGAQPDMRVTVEDFNGDGSWSITAEFLTTPPSPIVQLWADASFRITGDGSDIAFTDYNPSYDTSLGDAVVTNGPVASFVGNANAFFGTPDSSNPLYVASFDYAGSINDLQLVLFGTNSAIFDLPPFGDVRLYLGIDTLFGLTFEVQIVPAPASLAVASLALAATRRRR